MTHFCKGATMIVQTKSRTFRAKAAKAFSSQFDMIFPVYDLDRGGAAVPLVWTDVLSITVEDNDTTHQKNDKK